MVVIIVVNSVLFLHPMMAEVLFFYTSYHYGLDSRGIGVGVPIRARFSFSPLHPDWIRGPPSLLFNGCQRLSLGIKRPEREADHSPPAFAEVKNTWIYTSLSHMSSRCSD
jgi:hypothetical protein